jgi:hypothetical protein
MRSIFSGFYNRKTTSDINVAIKLWNARNWTGAIIRNDVEKEVVKMFAIAIGILCFTGLRLHGLYKKFEEKNCEKRGILYVAPKSDAALLVVFVFFAWGQFENTDKVLTRSLAE